MEDAEFAEVVAGDGFVGVVGFALVAGEVVVVVGFHFCGLILRLNEVVVLMNWYVCGTRALRDLCILYNRS